MPGLGYLVTLVAALAQGPVVTPALGAPDTAGVVVAEAAPGTSGASGGQVVGLERAGATRTARFDQATALAALVPVAPVFVQPVWSRPSMAGESGPLLPTTVSPLATDTPAPPPLIEYSDAYYTRLQIHKWASWAMLPLFAAQYFSGQKLVEQGRDAPGWARAIHGPAAAGVAGLFGVNTVTGVWNLWEGRKDPYGRKWRTAHGLLMLAADAGFVATGILAGDAGENGSVRNTHKQVAMVSMGVAVTSWLMMLPPFRRE